MSASAGRGEQKGKLPLPALLEAALAGLGGAAGWDFLVLVVPPPILHVSSQKRKISDKCPGFDPRRTVGLTVGHVTNDRYLADVC
jgi:hypothetical protein